MNPKKLQKLSRLAKVLDNGDIALLTELDTLEGRLEAVEGIVPALREARDGEVGPMGPRGDKGDSVKGEKGDPGRDGVNGKDSTVPGPVGPKGEKGDSIVGPAGKDGRDGKDGFIDEATIGYLEDEIKKLEKKHGGYGKVIRELRAGTGVTIDNSNQEYPIITNTNPKITVAATAPVDPVAGDIWIDTDAYAFRAVTNTYTITSEDYFLSCDGTFTITLPTAVSFTGEYIIKNVGTGLITVATTSSQTIDGVTTFYLIEDEVITLRSTNSNWLII